MSRNLQTRLKILTILSDCPISTTEQIARLFSHRGSPEKRASESMKELELEKLVEGKRRSIGESKVWRLTKKGRDLQQSNLKPVSFTSGKLSHYIAITDVYMKLQTLGEVKKWAIELREPFEIGNRKYTYCPDIFFVITTKEGSRAYLMEVQISPITSNRWGEKWAIASSFFESPAYKKASFQFIPNKIIKPRIIAVSHQQSETVRGGSNLNILHLPSIDQITL